ncbi:MAG: hypothetical protein GY841_10990 [FCB group bacterium]|nr:hypothetical protein [FCB group bacterium]
MRRIIVALILALLCGTASGQAILDPAPPMVYTLSCFGTLPAPATVRIELLSTVLAGGGPGVIAVFDIAVPAGAAAVWGPPILAAIRADPAVNAGPTLFGPGNRSRMTINSAAGIRLGIRAISTTNPPLPALPTMPPLAAAAVAWPITPVQLGAAAASSNFAAVALGPPAVPVGILGVHWLATPPFERTSLDVDDSPRLMLEDCHISASEWSEATPSEGIYSKIYFDFQHSGNPSDSGTFYVINDWMVNSEDSGDAGGLANPSPDLDEYNLFTFTLNNYNYEIRVYQDSASISPSNLADFIAKTNWAVSPNDSCTAHTIWEFSFRVPPALVLRFIGCDPAVGVWVLPQKHTMMDYSPQEDVIISGPSAFPHYIDGWFADEFRTRKVAPVPNRKYHHPSPDPDIPFYDIELQIGGGITATPADPGSYLENLPRNLVDPLHTFPGVTLDTSLAIVNVGNIDLEWTATIDYIDGDDWMILSDYGGTISPAPDTHYADIGVSLNYNNSLTDDPSGWGALVIFESNSPTSPDTVPIQLTVASDFSMLKLDSLDAGSDPNDCKALLVTNAGKLGGDDYLSLDIPRGPDECDSVDMFPNTSIWLKTASPLITCLVGEDTMAYTAVFDQYFSEDGTFRPQDDGLEWIDTLIDVPKCRFRVSTSDSIFGVQMTLSMPTDGVNDFVVGRNRFMLWDATETMEGVNVGMIVDWDIPADTSVNNFSGYIDTAFTAVPWGEGTATGHVFVVWQQGAEYHDDNSTVPCDISESDRYGGIAVFNLPDGVTRDDLIAWTKETTPHRLGHGFDPQFLYEQMRGEMDMHSTDSAIDLHTGINFSQIDSIISGATGVYTYSFALITTNQGFDDFIEQVKTAFAFAKFNEYCVRPGDANLDDAVNVGDAVWMINHVFKGGAAPGNLDHGDANNDGALNVGDAVYLINYVFKGGSAPVCGHANDADLMWK